MSDSDSPVDHRPSDSNTTPRRPTKLVVWDGDDTLWRGTLTAGDVPELPEGRLNLLQELCGMGVLQSVASTNDQADVETALHRLGIADYFLAPRGSLSLPKPSMVQAIMDDLCLVNPEEVLFLDDNPHHVDEVGVSLGIRGMTDVDPQRILPLCRRDHYTEEDRNRVAMYRGEIARKAAAACYPGDRTEFLRSLGLKATIRRATHDDVPRVWSLISRSNRMGAVCREFTEDEIVGSQRHGSLWVMEAEDKFGRYGTSAVARLSAAGVMSILVVSCRLRGKGLGSAFLGSLLNWYLDHSPMNSRISPERVPLIAQWVETKYNGEVRALFDWYKFDIQKHGDLCTATSAITPASLPDWISTTLES